MTCAPEEYVRFPGVLFVSFLVEGHWNNLWGKHSATFDSTARYQKRRNNKGKKKRESICCLSSGGDFPNSWAGNKRL